jgi:hypothetical protein
MRRLKDFVPLMLPLLVIAGLLCVAAPLSSGMPAQYPVYSNASLTGAYEVLLVTWTSPENVTNLGYLGIFTFNGAGGVSGSFTINTGGTITTDTYSGTYTVSRNGTGTLSVTDSLSNILALAFVIDSSGLKFVQTNPNGSTAVMNGTGTAQVLTSFSNASLSGNYGFLENKWDTTSDPNSSEPDTTVGLFGFNGNGAVTVSFTDEHKGSIVLTTGSGTYAVNSDGTATASITLSNRRVITFAMVLGSSGKTLHVLGTNCGCGNAVLAGTAMHQ